MFSPRPPRPGETALAEGPYTLLRLFCPFCGAPESAACRHRLFTADLEGIRHLAPAFEEYMRREFALAEGDFSDSTPLPASLRKSCGDWGEAASEAALRLGKSPAGNGCVVFCVTSPRRLDRRRAGFGSEEALRALPAPGGSG